MTDLDTSIIRRCIAVLLLMLALPGCSKEKVPNGRIMFKNDTMDSNYNQMYVSGPGVGVTLDPGEFVVLPKGTHNFSVSRQYKDYTRSYTVECPEISGRGIKIKMIDVHVNRIAGGCKTISASK